MVHVTWGILLAGGKEESLSDGIDTAFLNLGEKPVMAYSLEAMERSAEIDGVAVVVNKDRMNEVLQMVKLYSCTKVRRLVAGTTQRIPSLRTALKEVDENVTLIAVHEASRPLATEELFSQTVKAGKRYGAAQACTRLEDPVKIAERGRKADSTLEAGTAWVARSPGVYRREWLEEALEKGSRKGVGRRQDESAMVDACKRTIHMVPSPVSNIRLRTAEDLSLAEALWRF